TATCCESWRRGGSAPIRTSASASCSPRRRRRRSRGSTTTGSSNTGVAMRVEVVPGEPAELAERAAVWVADRMWSAVAERGRAHIAVSGGTTPTAMFGVLAALPVPWPAAHIWQLDERLAPPAHPPPNLPPPP